MKVINEVVKDATRDYAVLPLPFISYTKLKAKAYSYPPRRTAYRLVNSGENPLGTDKYVEILGVPTADLITYVCTYVTFPTPIIITGVTETIRGVDGSAGSVTNLDESLHPTILEYAVKLAEEYYLDKYSNTQDAQPKQ